MQLNFYDIGNVISTEPASISWSPSKINTARQCPRRLYYQYYGSKKFRAKNDPYKEGLQFFTGFSNKSLVAGEIIHAVIANYFRKAKAHEVWELDRLVSFAFRILQDTVKYTKAVKDGEPLIIEYPPSILKEIYYDTVNERELIDEMKVRIEVSLRNFSTSENFEHLRKGGRLINSLVEQSGKFELVPGVRIDGVIDLAFPDKDGYLIADWKTGSIDEEDTSLQLLTYALWATKKYQTKDSISIEKAYLFEDKVEKLEYSEVHLERARVRIIQDAEILRELHEFGLEGNYQAFAKCDKPKVCMLCPFEELCKNYK